MLQIRPARLADLPGIAAVLNDSFDDGLRLLLGERRDRASRLLELAYRGPIERGYSGILVAERDARVIGLLTIEPILYTPHERRQIEHQARTELGLLRLLRASFVLWLVTHPPEAVEAHVGLLAVTEDSQGEGIAARLLAEAEQWALDHHRQRLTACLSERSARAQPLFERAGFALVRSRSSLLARAAIGVRRWHFLAKPLADSRALVPLAER
jgi:GNAT superfamily N-acetyltransferase